MSDEAIRGWTDQPEFLEQGKSHFHGMFDGRGVQIIEDDVGVFYVTIGNLFGSQTIQCGSCRDAFRAIQLVYNAREGETIAVEKHGFRLIDEDSEGIPR